jgi:YkoY family integral membrane protein
VHIQASDFLTVLLLIALEGVLSVDNAMVLAVLALGLPKAQQKKVLRYGIAGAFAFRTVAVLFAVHLLRIDLVKLLGGIYLLYLPYQHFFGHEALEKRHVIRQAVPWPGLSAFWTTVVKVELSDIVFAADSILVGVAMSPKLWVVLSGGLLGILAMRLVIGQLLAIVERHPPLVDAAFVIIAWVGIKLVIEYLHAIGYVSFEVPKWLSLGLVVVIFAVGSVYALMTSHASPFDGRDRDAASILAARPAAEGRAIDPAETVVPDKVG